MINTFEKFADKINSSYSRESLVAGRLSTEYDFSGAKTVKVICPVTVPMSDYVRTGANRYGTPTELQDTVQELTLSQDKGFSLTIDKGNNLDQGGTKSASQMLALQISERAIPEMDAYVLARLAGNAGKVVANSTALSKSTVCTRISEGTSYLDDKEVPQDNRTLFVSTSTYKLLRLSDEFMKVEPLARQSLAKGQVGEFDGMPVIKVPSGRWPENVNFMIVHKFSATAPVKLADTVIHHNPPGISGNLLEGRQYYDCFVFGPRCNGVYVEICTAASCGTVCADPVILTEDETSPGTGVKGDITTTTAGATIKFTTDGTDPRYSPTAKTGSSSDVTDAGTVVKAYAFKSGAYASGVSTATL